MSTIKTKFIASNAITNAKLAQMATLTLKGNNTGGTTNALDLSVTQVQTMLSIPTSSSPLALNAGGTGVSAASANAAFNALSPMTTLGDIIYGGASGVGTRLAIGTTGQVLTVSGGGIPSWSSASTGTVTSVALTVPAFLSVAGSPVTTSGTLAVTLSGTALPIANGGTGQTSAASAFGALSPLTTKGDILGYSTVNARVPIGSDGQYLVADSTQTLGLKWANLFDQSYELSNLTINVTASAGTLTVALKDKAGSDPSATSPVAISFRSATITSGVFNTRSITSALSMTIAGTTTFGVASALARFIYIYAIDNAGTVSLAASVTPFDEGSTKTTSSSTTSNFVLYQASTVSAAPIRLIGRFLVTNTTNSYAAPSEVSSGPFDKMNPFCSYTNSAGTSITNSGSSVTLIYGNRVHDAFGMYDTATGVFTVPRDGVYSVVATAMFDSATWVAGNLYELSITDNTAAITLARNFNQAQSAQVNNQLSMITTVSRRLTAGSQLEIDIRNNRTAGSTSLIASASYNIVQVTWVGP